LAKTKDIYTQKLIANLALGPGADAEIFAPFTDAFLPQDLVGFVIKEVSYHLETPLHTLLDTDGDRLKFGLSFLATSPAGGLEVNDPGVLDHNAFSRHDIAALAADILVIEHNPIVRRDFTNLGGEGINNGLLVHPVNLFAWGYTDAAIGATGNMHVVIDYLQIDLTDALHKELWQSIYIRQV